MGNSRPVLAVCQSVHGTHDPVRCNTSSTVAAWHRANSYLETYASSSDLRWSRLDAKDGVATDPEQQPLLAENHTATTIECSGGSTLTQTILNSMNSLLGVGLLSLPLAFRYSGWLISLAISLGLALLTWYTAQLLARCMGNDPSCRSYIDIATKAYGPVGRRITIFLFSLITVTASVALVILFAESMHALVEGVSVTKWKLICGAVLLPLHFAPFHILSMTSVLGIAACGGVVVLVISSGLTTASQPGSLLHPTSTAMIPTDWMKMPLSLGLLMSPWTAHAILPNLYRDMSQPTKFVKATGYSFGGAYIIDIVIAAAGYLMYGGDVADAITGDVIRTTQSLALAIALTVLVALMPISKVPLMSRPLILTTEYSLGLVNDQEETVGGSSRRRQLNHLVRCTIRLLWVVLLVAGAVGAPDFSLVMAFMGSALCYTIAVILPLLFYQRIFREELNKLARIKVGLLLATSSLAAIVGTVWAFIPQSVDV